MKSKALVLLLALFSAVGLMASDPGPGGPTSKGPILYGSTATLWPNFQDGTGVIDNGVGTVTSGNPSGYTVMPLVTTTYTLTITNIPGDIITSQVVVSVQTVVVAPISPATKIVSATRSCTFTSSVTGALDPSIDWSVDGILGGNSAVGTIVNGVYTAPATPGTHTITATSHANPAVYQNATANVVPLPTIDTALTATPSTILYGGTSVLSATFSNGTAQLVGGAINQAVTSPLSLTTPALIATTTYTLTVTNPAGDSVSGNVTVTVTDVTMTDLSPLTKNLSLTKTQQVNGGVVSNAVDPSVIWSVNGVDGGNAELGTINATGLYSAPAVMPSATLPATDNIITIRCRSAANPAVFKEMVITLYKLPTIQSFTVN